MPIMAVFAYNSKQVHLRGVEPNATNVTRGHTCHEINLLKLFSIQCFIESTVYERSNAIKRPVLS